MVIFSTFQIGLSNMFHKKALLIIIFSSIKIDSDGDFINMSNVHSKYHETPENLTSLKRDG